MQACLAGWLAIMPVPVDRATTLETGAYISINIRRLDDMSKTEPTAYMSLCYPRHAMQSQERESEMSGGTDR